MNGNVPFLSFDPRANGVSNASVFHRVYAATLQRRWGCPSRHKPLSINRRIWRLIDTAVIVAPLVGKNSICGIPSFEDNNRPFSGLEICLLDRLHDKLHRLQPALIICKPNGGMPGGFGQCGTFNDNKILGLHTQSLMASPFRFALIEIKRDRACSQVGRRLRSTAPDQRCPQRIA
jgi:hypothetical protein